LPPRPAAVRLFPKGTKRGAKWTSFGALVVPEIRLKALQIGDHRLGRTWAHIAIIPTNNPIDAKAAASSTKTLNITASLLKNIEGT
jgi:hypothetical protein